KGLCESESQSGREELLATASGQVRGTETIGAPSRRLCKVSSRSPKAETKGFELRDRLATFQLSSSYGLVTRVDTTAGYLGSHDQRKRPTTGPDLSARPQPRRYGVRAPRRCRRVARAPQDRRPAAHRARRRQAADAAAAWLLDRRSRGHPRAG